VLAVLGTGAPKTSVFHATVERLDLPVDTSGAVGRSIVPALDANAPQCATHIDRLKIGMWSYETFQSGSAGRSQTQATARAQKMA